MRGHPAQAARVLEALPADAAAALFARAPARLGAAVLDVLLPVVAGQSGNAGAQALAVTMRGLVLREISQRHWHAVVGKEALTGLINGLAMAATAGLAVHAWRRSLPWVGVIMLAMVNSMLAAAMAGASVPIRLRRFGQDPATASSIILSTLTDVVGSLSFLGIAALFAPLLVQATS